MDPLRIDGLELGPVKPKTTKLPSALYSKNGVSNSNSNVVSRNHYKIKNYVLSTQNQTMKIVASSQNLIQEICGLFLGESLR